MTLEIFTLQLDLECRDGYDLTEEDDDIAQLLNDVSNSNTDEIDSEISNEFEKISPETFLKSLNTVRAFVQSNGAKDNIYRALAELEIMGISKKIDNSNNQTTITKFFK